MSYPMERIIDGKEGKATDSEVIQDQITSLISSMCSVKTVILDENLKEVIESWRKDLVAIRQAVEAKLR